MTRNNLGAVATPGGRPADRESFFRSSTTAALALGIALLILLISGCGAGSGGSGVSEDVIRENTLGTAYLGQQEWETAAATFSKALTLRPGDPMLLNNLGVALIQMGDPEAAEVRLAEAIAADADYPYANYNLGLIFANRGQFEDAAASFELVAHADPDDLLTQYNLGVAYSSLGREADAEATLRRALELDPEHVSSLYALGRLLVAQGSRDEGSTMIALSQDIRARSGLDTAVGSQYGEQGPYAMGVEYPGDALAAPDAITVAFAPADSIELRLSGAPVLVPLSPDGRPGWVFADALPPNPSGGKIITLAAGDADSDGVVEIFAVVGDGAAGRVMMLEQNDNGEFSWSPDRTFGETLAIPGDIGAAAATLVDRDHDGDLDVFLCWLAGPASDCAIATNDGTGAFSSQPAAAHGFDVDLGAARAVRVGFSDFDNDRDMDLLVGASNNIHVLLNQRDGNFRATKFPVEAPDGAAVDLADMAIVDINKDNWMDVVVGGADGLRLLANERGRVGPAAVIAGRADPVVSLAVLDADNDGFIDLIAAAPDGATQAYRNNGRGEWRDADWLSSAPPATTLAAFDADADGDVDLVGADDSAATLLVNEGGNANRWITVESIGVGDNKFGIGSKVEIMAGALRQKFEITGPLPVHAGVGGREQVDSVRHLWPSGVLQDEIRQPSGRVAKVTQLDRKGTSCPLLYVWQDGRWQFVTDFLGGAAIGYQHAPGVYSNPDTDEYILLEQSPSVDADGNLRVRINNQLQEIIWFDQVELIAVDHPVGTHVFPNERLMPGPPWPDYGLFVSDDIRPVANALSVDNDADLTGELALRDRDYVDDFELLPFKGYAEGHTIEIDLGRFPDADRVVLLLDGWIDYADSSANVAAHQAGAQLTPPVLTVADGEGGWRGTGHLMGFPAGLPKTMAVDLSGLFPSDDHRIRIATNMRIYWDRARVLFTDAGTEHAATRLAPVSAELDFGGFPDEISSDNRDPFAYDPESVTYVSPWKAHVGRYTEFGDVTGLVAERDDRMITSRSGDQIELRFRSPGPVADGMVRSYLLFADGFGKDMDPNSAANDRVGPMPFHGMPTYPYPESVTPPFAADQLGRYVPESDRGLPGALPQPLAPLVAKEPGAPGR